MPSIDWEAKYHAGTTGWERPGLNPAFTAWREDGTLAPCRILLPGAGRSPEPLAFAEAGFDVTVVDLAPSAIAAQRARFAAAGRPATLVEADLLEWGPERPFDAVYDQTCLCALPPALHAAYVGRLSTWLRPGGHLHILFMQTGRPEGPPFDCPIDQMRALFPSIAWNWPVSLPDPVPHPAGFIEQPVVLRRV